jgi:hypothetical protein
MPVLGQLVVGVTDNDANVTQVASPLHYSDKPTMSVCRLYAMQESHKSKKDSSNINRWIREEFDNSSSVSTSARKSLRLQLDEVVRSQCFIFLHHTQMPYFMAEMPYFMAEMP